MKRTIISTLLLMLMTQVSIGQTLKTYSGLYEGGPTRIRLTVGRSNLQAFQRLSIMLTDAWKAHWFMKEQCSK